MRRLVLAAGLVLAAFTAPLMTAPPEVVKVPRLVEVKDLRPGDHFCEELNDDVWLVTVPAGNPADYPASNYYGLDQLPVRLDAVYCVSLTTGKLYLWARHIKVRPVIDARVTVRVHDP